MVSTHWFIAMFTAQPGMFPLTSSWNSHRYSTCVIEIKIPINTRGHGSGHLGRDRICMPVGCGGRTCPSVLWRRAELAKNWSIRTTPCMHAASGTTKHTSQLKVRECRDSQHVRPKTRSESLKERRWRHLLRWYVSLGAVDWHAPGHNKARICTRAVRAANHVDVVSGSERKGVFRLPVDQLAVAQSRYVSEIKAELVPLTAAREIRQCRENEVERLIKNSLGKVCGGC